MDIKQRTKISKQRAKRLKQIAKQQQAFEAREASRRDRAVEYYNIMLQRLRTTNETTLHISYPYPINYLQLFMTLSERRHELVQASERGHKVISIKIGNTWRTVTPQWLSNLSTIIDSIVSPGSAAYDYVPADYLEQVNDPTLSSQPPQFSILVDNSDRRARHGGFYNKVVTLPDTDLRPFQIYNEEQMKTIEPDKIHHCLYNSIYIAAAWAKVTLPNGPVIRPEYVKGDTIATKYLGAIADDSHVRILLIKDDQGKKSYRPHTPTIAPDGTTYPVIKIGMIGDHYIPYYEGIYTYVSSLERGGYLRPMTVSEMDHLGVVYRNVPINNNFTIGPKDCRPLSVEPKVPSPHPTHVSYFDFETTTDGPNGHEPYLVSFTVGNKIETRTGSDCGKQMLNRLKSYYMGLQPCKRINLVLIAHNLNYDFTFIMKYINNGTIFGTTSAIKGVSCSYYEMNLRCVDSYRFLSCKLADMPAMVSKPEIGSKYVMPYTLYTTANISKHSVTLQELREHASDEDILEMINTNPFFFTDDSFLHMSYAKYYCEQDVRLLQMCFNHFADIVNKSLQLNVFDFYTVASLADYYFKINKCFDGVYELTGDVREYIQKAVSGGRSHTFISKPIATKTPLVDFDAVSLYPSAIYRLKGMIPKGAPKVLQPHQLNKDFLDTTTMYYVTVHFKRYGKHITFPPLYTTTTYEDISDEATERELREYLYYLPDSGHTDVVSRIKLEDIIQYHELQPDDYTILAGVYFDQGFNDTFCTKMREVFDLRLQAKARKDPIQVVYKLIMNSAYGKTLEKVHSNTTTIKYCKDADDMKRLLSKSLYTLKEYSVVGDKTVCITRNKVYNKHFNRVHIGALVLDMSKRIMYEVLEIIDDIGAICYYIDTDSTHIAKANLPTIEDEYRKKHHRELVGEDMGQFHSDFELKGAVDDVTSVLFIGLAPKVYMDKLVGHDKNGDYLTGYHLRMKGISRIAIDDAVERYSTPELPLTYEDIYLALFNYQKLSFDLLARGSVSFERNKAMNMTSRSSFTRELYFPDKAKKWSSA